MNISSTLKALGYFLDENQNVWIRSAYQGIAYNDGDATEERIAGIIKGATDITVLSPELRGQCTDWPSLYHLGASRANIVRPFEKHLQGKKVLEVGAGCGAITRFLGESGAHVLALEGTPRRASIARSRTRDLPNVNVVTETFSQFKWPEKFDVITLIGVLEYANLFVPGEAPAQAMLKRCLELLEPEGRLIVAIENQFGLKYFSGAPEDHVGVRMYGIEGRYTKKQPQTYGRKALEKLMLGSGFKTVEIMAPYPDYKFPYSIVTDAGFKTEHFDPSAFAWQSARRDPQWMGTMTLSMELAWPGLFENGMALDLANSFLVSATPNAKEHNSVILAYHYSTERIPGYCKQAIFERNANTGAINVLSEKLVDGPAPVNTGLIFGLEKEDAYTLGTPLSWDFIKIVTREGWRTAEVVGFFKNYRNVLEGICEQRALQPEILEGTGELGYPGAFFDILPQNIIRTPCGKYQVIDTEWKTLEAISESTLMFRSLINLTQMVTRYGGCADSPGITREQLFSRLFLKLGLDASKARLSHLLSREAELQESVTGRSFGELVEWWPGLVLNTHDLQTGSDAKIHEQKAVIDDRDRHIESLKSSLSWRVTQPLRDFKQVNAHTIQRLKRVRDGIRRRGGVARTLVKALRLLKKGGAQAVFSSVSSSVSNELQGNDYGRWQSRYDFISPEVRNKIVMDLAVCQQTPMISILMPTYNSNPVWLREAIDTVLGQTYQNWELCIADDASTDPQVRAILDEYAAKDQRVKVVYRAENGHISAASNSALEIAGGDWVCLLDHDDRLAEHALALIVEAINEDPDAEMFYSDEDKLDKAGNRIDPYFKPDFDPDLLRGQNMVCHLGVFRKTLIQSVDGFRTGFEGAQDHDLVLRVTERTALQKVHHIPHVLYHWRMHVNSTSETLGAKGYAYQAGMKAVQEHIYRMGLNATVEETPYSYYRIRYHLPTNPPRVSIIIPTRNGHKLTRQCIESIRDKSTYPNYEIILVDNGSDDPAALKYFQSLHTDTSVRVIRDERPFNFSQLNNTAVAQATGEYVCLMNNDIEVISSDWLEEMVGLAMRPDTGVVGACLWYPDNTLQHGGVVLGVGGVAGHSQKHMRRTSEGYFGRGVLTQTYSAVTAACCVVRKTTYEEVGGLNEVDLMVAFNDVDFCLKVRQAGYRNVWTPFAELYHHESASRGYEDTPEKQERFTREEQYMLNRWGYLLQDDPAYNPNLTLEHEDFTLAWPPRRKFA